MEKNSEYTDALEKSRIFFLEKCGEMSLAHYRALTSAFKTAYELGLQHGKSGEAGSDENNAKTIHELPKPENV